MNNRALVLDVEATGISDDAQATELGWCDVYFNEKGELQPSSKAFVQRCKPELPISFGSMAVTHIHDDELVNEPSHRDVIQHVVNNSVTYVIGHNVDYDMKVVGNAGVNHQFKRICSLAIARACYPIDTDHKLLAMLYMLDYEFARKHGKNAHSAKFDVMFCVRILRIMCINNNITNMEQLYQFSEHCRVPVYMNFGKHKGKLIDDVDLSYKQYMLGKGLEDPYVALAFERSVAKNLAQIAERNRIAKENKEQERTRIAASEEQNPQQSQSQSPSTPVIEDAQQQPMLLDLPETAQSSDDNNGSNVTNDVDKVQDQAVTQDVSASDNDLSEEPQASVPDTTDKPTDTTPKKEKGDGGEVVSDTSVEAQDPIIIENETLNAEDEVSDTNKAITDNIDTADSATPKPPKKKVQKDKVVAGEDGVNPKAPKKKKKTASNAKASVCKPPEPDDIPPSLMSETEEASSGGSTETQPDANPASTVPEQDDDFYKNPTKFDPMSKQKKSDPLFKETNPSTDPYGTPVSEPQDKPL